MIGTGNDKGECEDKPRKFTRPMKSLACVPKGASEHWTDFDQTGNYVQYYVKDKILELEMVRTDYCQPKPGECNCKALLSRVLQANKGVNEIKGTFMARPWVFGCNCYLGTAARAGFKHVKLDSNKKICQDKREFNEKNYGKICALYGKQKCEDSKTPPRGKITKT